VIGIDAKGTDCATGGATGCSLSGSIPSSLPLQSH
jgi:hypothetical protein